MHSVGRPVTERQFSFPQTYFIGCLVLALPFIWIRWKKQRQKEEEEEAERKRKEQREKEAEAGRGRGKSRERKRKKLRGRGRSMDRNRKKCVLSSVLLLYWTFIFRAQHHGWIIRPNVIIIIIDVCDDAVYSNDSKCI